MKTTPAPPPARVQVDDLVAELHRAHALTLVRMANLLLRDRHCAEDVVQDTFLNLYRVLPKLTDHDEILPYLRTAVLNRARSALRTRR
jgi:DNA-directed RNA polymerase specialized sigma24 family protein